MWCWPAGIVNVTLFIFIFFHVRLYGSMALQAIYLGLSIYGWWQWLHGGAGGGRLVVSRTPRRWLVGLSLSGVSGSIALGFVLATRTDAALPYLDAALTSFSLVAQLMTTRKWIEAWLVWIGVDVIYVGMYASQRLRATPALYALFLVLAIAGWRQWRQSMHERMAPRVGT